MIIFFVGPNYEPGQSQEKIGEKMLFPCNSQNLKNAFILFKKDNTPENLNNIENLSESRLPRSKVPEKRRSFKKTLSKLKENQTPINTRKKSEPKIPMNQSSPFKTTKITDFFAKKQQTSANQAKIPSTSTLRNLERSNTSTINIKVGDPEILQKSHRSAGFVDGRREIVFENLKMREEIRKLNKILVDQDNILEDTNKKITTLKIVNQSQIDMLETARENQKVSKHFSE